jgi:hypothetical protein
VTGAPRLLLAPVLAATIFRFDPVQPDALSGGGSLVNAWADYDGDGDLDLFVGFNGQTNRLYRNDAGTLVDDAAAAGIADRRATRAAAWGDFDADGDPDLLVGFAPGDAPVLRLYRNTAGRFLDVAGGAGLEVKTGAVRQPVWIDVDADGDLDLFLAFRDRANTLFRNDKGRFTDVAPVVGLADARRSVGAVWFDYDEDGDLDVYVGNMDGDANGLFRNDRGTFVDVAGKAGLAWGGRPPDSASHGTVRPCAADVDGDGRLDLVTANYGPLGLFLNRGDGRFEDVSARWRIDVDAKYDTCAPADIDHDGLIDVYVNGTVTGGISYRDFLFRNAGGRFEEATPQAIASLAADHGAHWTDFDRDGDLDLSLNGAGTEPIPLLLRNTLDPSVARRSLAVRVLDRRGRATRAGAEVRIFAAGTRRVLGARIVDSGSGYDSQNDLAVHFGFATLDVVDVEVTFPSLGKRPISARRRVDPRHYHGRALVIRL